MNKLASVVFLLITLGFAQHFGLGIILGSPTGFTGKGVFTRNSAIAANIGWSFIENYHLHITTDYQFLFPSVIRWQDDITRETKEIKGLAPFLGIGGRLRFKETTQNTTELNVGLRLGGGIEWTIARFGVFLEIYPVVNIFPATDFDLEGGLGIRFYFR